MKFLVGVILAIAILQAHVLPQNPGRSDSSATVRVLRVVAEGVLKSATFDFINPKTGDVYQTPAQAGADMPLQIRSNFNDWRYWNGVLNIAMSRLAEELADTSYSLYVRKDIAFNFDNRGYFERRQPDEGKWNHPFGQLLTMEELDDCGAMGASLIEVYATDNQERYRTYLERAANHIEHVQARLDDGTLVRSFPRKWTLWADDLYMSVSFLARMGALTGEKIYLEDAARQVVNFHKYLYDGSKGLMYHCWFSDSGKPGVAFWGRANGWMLLGQIDLLDRIPQDLPQRDTLLYLFRRQVAGIVRYQAADGFWHQLLDRTDSFEETSCTAMFTYSIARAVSAGYIDEKYAEVAVRGWNGIKTRIAADGDFTGVCAGTGVGDDLQFYYSRPTPLNDPHGLGAILLAGTAVLKLGK